MLSNTTAARAACTINPALFQHELLEEPSLARGSADRQREAAVLTARAAAACSGCPLFASCLYDAVVNYDVAGFAAGTTQAERGRIRARLGVTVEKEDLDALAGVVRGGRQVNHDEIVRLRNANPHESLEVLALRLGCSLSTVKRHMRKERQATGRVALTTAKPSRDSVLAAYAAVVGTGASRERQVA